MDPSEAKLKRWREDCLYFATDELNFQPDPWQVELFQAFSSNDPQKKRIAMAACKGVGKSAALAICILNFMASQGERGEHPKGGATSITEDNISNNLWPEISKWQGRSEYLKRAYTWTKTRFFSVDHPETWFFSLRTWPKSGDKNAQANTLAGLHSKYLLFVVDESGDVPDSVFAAADAGLTGTEAGRFQKLLQAGNPTKREGPLYRACFHERDLWYVIKITGDPDNPLRSARQNIEWARDQIKRYGRDSPWVLVNVLGEFPETSINAILSSTEIEAAMKRMVHYDGYKNSQKRIGCDVARMGDDMTCLFPRQGLRAFNFVEMSGADGTEVADRLITSKEKWQSELEFIDDTGGFGGSVIDSMFSRGYSPIPVNFSSKATDPRYYNKRAEMYFRMRAWFKRGAQLPNDPRLLEELCATKYTSKNGKIILVPKELIKAELGRSPDRGDALALTFAQEEAVSRLSLEGTMNRDKPNHAETEWDPYESTAQD
jgi:hypothetical protein